MPRYEYQCPTCHGLHELSHPSSDAAMAEPRPCPVDGMPMERVIRPVGVSFKGGGWTPKFGPHHF